MDAEERAAARLAVPEQLHYGSARGRRVLLATILASGMAQLDGTIVNVALPRIGTNLHVGLSSLQWVVNAYALTLAGLLLLGGSLGDRLGRRRVFVVGVSWFAAASVGCALAPSAGALVTMRAVQGIGGALLTPGSLAILQAVFAPADRAPAVGAWSGLSGVAAAIGPVVGGLLVGLAPWGWRLAFLLNVPLALAVLVAVRQVPETRDEHATGSLDVAGAVLAALGLAFVVYGLTEGAAHGWRPAAVLALAGGGLVLAVFLVVEHRRANPMMPPRLFRSAQFSAANGATFLVYAALGAVLFLAPVELQRGAGFAPVAAGAALLPVTVLMLLLSSRAGRLAARRGPRLPMTVGPMVVAAGLLMLVGIGPRASYGAAVLPGVVVLGLGLSLTVAPLTATVLAAAPASDVGIASAVNNDVARTAGLLAVAVFPALSGISGQAYDSPTALSHGFQHAMVIAAALCVLGGLVSARWIRTDLLGAPRAADLGGS